MAAMVAAPVKDVQYTFAICLWRARISHGPSLTGVFAYVLPLCRAAMGAASIGVV